MLRFRIAHELRKLARALEQSAERSTPVSRDEKPGAWSSMAVFLEDLEEVADAHAEIFDTDVRERLWTIIDHVLIIQTSAVEIPEELGMFSPEGNARLRHVLDKNLRRLVQVFEALGLDTERKRRGSFLNPKLHTERGHSVEDFFGSP